MFLHYQFLLLFKCNVWLHSSVSVTPVNYTTVSIFYYVKCYQLLTDNYLLRSFIVKQVPYGTKFWWENMRLGKFWWVYKHLTNWIILTYKEFWRVEWQTSDKLLNIVKFVNIFFHQNFVPYGIHYHSIDCIYYLI